MIARIRSSGSMEQHFLLSIYLMLFFFLADYATDALVAFKLTTVKIGSTLARDSFLAFFGVAIGIFRGMGEGGKPDGSGKADQ